MARSAGTRLPCCGLIGNLICPLLRFGSPSPVRGAAGEIGGVEVASQYCSGNKILLPKVRSSQTKVSIATLVKQTVFCLGHTRLPASVRSGRAAPPRERDAGGGALT